MIYPILFYSFNMYFLLFDSGFRVLICTRCKYALAPGTIGSVHNDEVTKIERRNCVNIWKNKPLQPARNVQQLDLPADIQPILNLALYHNGIRCSLCSVRPYIVGQGNDRSMREHLKAFYNWESNNKGGRPSKAMITLRDQGAQNRSSLSIVTVAPVSYQTFYRNNFIRFFEVITPLEPNIRAPRADL
jgi:hypothetical protein